jgi:hypothetical protein
VDFAPIEQIFFGADTVAFATGHTRAHGEGSWEGIKGTTTETQRKANDECGMMNAEQ